MTDRGLIQDDNIECPLCLGEGHLKRTEVLDRLGVRDFARVAQLSAEEAFRLLQNKNEQDEQSVWARFEAELTKRTTLIADRDKDELHALRAGEQQRSHEIEHANCWVEDSLREVGELRERNHELESEMAKVARVGKKEEMDFADEVRTWVTSATNFRRMATTCWHSAMPAGPRWNLDYSWTTRIKTRSRRATSGS